MLTGISHGVKKLTTNSKGSKQVMTTRLRRCRWGVAEAEPQVHQCRSIVEAQAIIQAWRADDNQCRPHNSLTHLIPSEFVMQRQASAVVEEVAYSGGRLITMEPTSTAVGVLH